MLIVSNCLAKVVDEGALKVANSLVKRIRASLPDSHVVAYERVSPIADSYFELNKLLLNREFIKLVRKCNQPVLYIPFPAKAIATALRIFMLSLFSKKKVSALLVLSERMTFAARLLLKMSGADVIVLSKNSEEYYRSFLPQKRVKYLKCGIDIQKFSPVDADSCKALKAKYGFDTQKPIVLHVGHLKEGRGVGVLADIDTKYQVLLVTSTLTKDEQDEELRKKLLSRPNVRIIDEYLESVEEVYRMADVYLFPVLKEGNCIDVPLSCLEAAACNKPVITTSYGEMKEFLDKKGFFLAEKLDGDSINRQIEGVLAAAPYNTRDAVCEYDWQSAKDKLSSFLDF